MSENRSPYNCRAVKVTSRELEVMRLVARGRTYKQIGIDLGIAERTVLEYVAKLKFTWGANSLAQLIHMLTQAKIL